jgi:hypothetical protein
LAGEILIDWREEQVLVLSQQEGDRRDHDHQDRDEGVQVLLLLAEALVRLGVVVMRELVGQHRQVQQGSASLEL